jgi:Xaa-Pro aminopeptidase
MEITQSPPYIPTRSELNSLLNARDRAWELLYESAELIKPGMNEEAARKLVLAHFKSAGITQHWHAPKIRFGSETLKNFSGAADQSVVLKNDDIFFLDYGPALGGFEADVGDTFVVGQRPDYLHLQKACREIFKTVEAHWKKTAESGKALYEFAEKATQGYGLNLDSDKAGGHVIGEFPHKVKLAGRVGGSLKKQDSKTVDGVWVLEIQLSLPDQSVGAFYEDILIEATHA